MQKKTTVMAHRRYRGKTTRVFAGMLILTGLLLAGCNNPLNSPDTPAARGGLVRIVVGDADGGNARTVQPAASALAGYRLTFSNNGHDPVDIGSGNSADVYLPDGSYTITATAYKSGGQIGNNEDAAASGSIVITLSDGVVASNGGIVPPIILYPGYGNGTLEYSITSAAAVSGTMKLWSTYGWPYYGFGTSGELTLGAAPDLSAETCTLEANRYIAEIRLENASGDIAFLREVVEIWAGVTTSIVFAPEVYLDPSAVPAYSGATLSAASIIGGLSIGAPGTGSGADEANAINYSLKVLDITNVALNFMPENDSLLADISWVANTGTAPGGIGYSDTSSADFSTDSVLWVKVVSEDGSAARYYKFTLAALDSDLTVSGDSLYNYVGDTLRIIGDGTYTIGMKTDGATTTRNRIEVASGVTANITLNGVKINSGGAAFGMTDATVTLALVGTNELRSGGGAGLGVPAGSSLTINATDETHSLSARGGDSGAGIGGSGTITINGGTITAQGGQRAAGIGGNQGGPGGIITINGGTVTANGGYVNAGQASGAGIGGGYGGRSGTILIAGGVVTATGQPGAAGIGGGYFDGYNNETITINGGTVTATGGEHGAGIGGGMNNECGTIIITGGIVNATGGASCPGLGAGYNRSGGTFVIKGGIITATGSAHGIGGGQNSHVFGDGTITELSGNAVVFASSIAPGIAITAGGNATQAIVFNGANGNMYGDITLQQDLTNTRHLHISNVLTVPDNVTFTNDSYITVNDGGRINGDVINNGTINLNNGAVIDRDITNGGTINVYGVIDRNVINGGTINVYGVINGGMTNNGTIIVRNEGVINGAVTNDETIRVYTGGAIGGNITNNGTVVVYSGGVISGTVTVNPPVDPYELVITGGSSYTYTEYRPSESAGVLTITGDGTYTVAMRADISVSNDYRIVVASGVTADITLNGVNIDMSSGGVTAFDMAGATVQLTLTGTNVLKSGVDYSYSSTGMPGVYVPEGSSLTITAASAGSLEAVGGDGTYGAAGIGGVWNGAGGTIAIKGGVVTAIGSGYYGGPGIGGGYNGAAGTIAELSGNAVVFASSIQPTLTAGDNATGGIAFNGNAGTMYGNVTLQQDLTIPSDKTLGIPAHITLTIGSATLTNSGTIIKYHGGVITGTVAGNQPVDSDLTITGSASYTYAAGLLTITGNETYTIAMRNGVTSTTTDRIAVASSVTANITLNEVNINMGSSFNTTAFDMTGATVQLTLIGTNVLNSGQNRAGLQAPEGSTLTINAADETHSLSAIGGYMGAGIGGGGGGAGGTVTISGGTVTATGGGSGAGIGGGNDGAGGTITINGSTVTATGGYYGAGIGGGNGGTGGTVTISGGTVTVTGGNYGAGIGGGNNSSNAGTIEELSGNAVVFASSIAPTLTAGVNATQAIVFNGTTGTMYGSVILQQDVTLPEGYTLNLSSGNTLTIPGNVTLTNEGTINQNGGTIDGTVGGGGTVN